MLEQFSIPLDPDESPAPGEPLPSTSRRQTRTQLSPVEGDEDATDGDGSDIVPGKDIGDDDDDDFDEDISTRIKKSKGKEKLRKGKFRAKAIPAVKQVFDGSVFYGKNPKVMLISLKAGALGLNLTVANHVFL